MATAVLPIDHLGPGSAGGHDSWSAETVTPDERRGSRVKGERLAAIPMVPGEVPMSEEAERRLATYLAHEIRTCRSERQPLVSKWARLRDKYRTKFPEIPKDWPIQNASQLIVPTIKIAVHSLGPRLYQTIMAGQPLVSVRTKDPEFQDFAFSHEEFLDLYGREKIDMEELLDGVVSECIKLGDAIVEITTRRDFRSLSEWDAQTNSYTKERVEVFNGPTMYHIPLEDFWIRPAFTDIQSAPWCGKVLRLTWSDIKNMALSGELNPDQIEKIYRHAENVGSQGIPETIVKEEEREKYTPQDRDVFEVFEIAVRWDVDSDTLDEELIVYFHEPSETILRRKHNGFKKGRRPWDHMRYIKVEHRFYSEGLAEILEHLQEEISTMHNQRIDNATMANLQIVLVAKLIRGLSPGDKLWTGKIVKVTDVAKDVGTLRLGETYPSTTEAERITQMYIREVGATGEMMTGQAQPVTRTTATAQMAMLEEANRRFDKILKGMRRFVLRIHKHLADLFAQQGTGGLAEAWLGVLKGREYEQYLRLPDELMTSRIKLQMSYTKSSVNREIEFQSQIAVMQLMTQVAQQTMQLASQFAPQSVPILAHEFIKGLTPIVKKIFQYADAGDPEQAVSALRVLERLLPPPEDMGGMAAAEAAANSYAGTGGAGATAGAANGGGGQGAAGAPQPARLDDLVSLLGQANRRQPATSESSRNGRRVART